ncbi:MAG: hypothetical protein AAGE86_13245 [Pseudomonadota bacterium]
MDSAVLIFFGTVIVVTAMICWTVIAVTTRIVEYKTLQAAGETGAAPSSAVESEPVPAIEAVKDPVDHISDLRRDKEAI